MKLNAVGGALPAAVAPREREERGLKLTMLMLGAVVLVAPREREGRGLKRPSLVSPDVSASGLAAAAERRLALASFALVSLLA